MRGDATGVLSLRVYAIADLHLPGGDKKPMDVFGAHWADHFERISEDWRARVTGQDVVLLPGDLSWAMRLSDALADLLAIGALPGHKIILRGNHDYWWNAIGKVRAVLPEGMYAIQNDCVEWPSVLIAGTRGWTLPGDAATDADKRIYARECMRLEMTLSAARRISADKQLVVMMHYPPLIDSMRDTGFTALLERFGAAHVVYGHLHGAALASAYRGVWRGVTYHQVSSDGLGFRLYRLPI